VCQFLGHLAECGPMDAAPARASPVSPNRQQFRVNLWEFVKELQLFLCEWL